VKKLPSRFHKYALPMGTSFFMTFLVTGVATWRALGWDRAMFEMWFSSWMIAWAIAAPTMYFVMPAVRRTLSYLTEEEETKAP
jgi:Protein of unknown function (DUF2798)